VGECWWRTSCFFFLPIFFSRTLSLDFSFFLRFIFLRNPNAGNNSKPIGFQNRFDAFDKRKNRGFEHENNFQEVNQQNSSTRSFFFSFFRFLVNSLDSFWGCEGGGHMQLMP
jgi:hypothetical protein